MNFQLGIYKQPYPIFRLLNISIKNILSCDAFRSEQVKVSLGVFKGVLGIKADPISPVL